MGPLKRVSHIMLTWHRQCLWFIRCSKGWYFLNFPRNFPYNLCLNVQNSISSSSKTVQSSPEIRNSFRRIVIGLWPQVKFIGLSIKSTLSTRISLSTTSMSDICSSIDCYSSFTLILVWVVTNRITVLVFSKFSENKTHRHSKSPLLKSSFDVHLEIRDLLHFKFSYQF